ncbi:DUF1186 domain-containing protein [Roseibium litorale]|uniref:DUF1186 domain-containing protein n=1 Tax=Roseibium litorale TaxID=2803841 RepID=A0ABR9CN93_9HYPH|nr:DUF1186 domain-containing protein [Roseibium litorale]MBD8892358.1 DUF1186 domain-containing protein [Roseibium litorale]
MNRQELIASLARRDLFPWRTIDLCLKDPSLCIPPLLLLLERKARGLSLNEDENRALYYGIHLLAALKVREAAAPLTAVLCGNLEEAAELVGDSIGDTVPRLLMAFTPAMADHAWDVVASPQIDWIIREAFLRAWTFAVLQGEVPLDIAAEKLKQFPATVCPEPDSFLWAGWLNAIADLNLQELQTNAGRAFENGQISADEFGFFPADIETFRSDLARMAASDPKEREAILLRRGYRPFQPTNEDFMRAARHVLTREEEEETSSMLLKAAESDSPYNH